jgi:hypothetical protein
VASALSQIIDSQPEAGIHSAIKICRGGIVLAIDVLRPGSTNTLLQTVQSELLCLAHAASEAEILFGGMS